MPPVKGVSSAHDASELLRLATEADTPERRAELAERGLALESADEPSTAFLLLRQLYLAQLEAHRFREAIATTERMAAVGPMIDLAHHDAARAWSALGEDTRAVQSQRLAARTAPPDRRSFQYWSLGNLLHQQGDLEGALAALAKGRRWAREDRPLLNGHAAWIELARGDAPEDLDGTVQQLERSRAGKGIGRLVLGMIAYEMGDARRAAMHLRAFLRRNASADPAKALSLREELRIARTALADLESD
jgi:tetratricopeptide (TPR) repeat protein